MSMETVKDLIESYKECLENMKKDFEQEVKAEEHDIAYLNSLDPATPISPAIWKDYKSYAHKTTPSNT